MDITLIQQQLFQHIKIRLAGEAPMVEEIARLLNISTDSAYRRIRGEKLITFDELYRLAVSYRISLDQLMDLNTGSILFQGQYLDKSNFRFENYISNLVQNMAYISSFQDKQMYYSCKDMPIFHHYYFREVAAFKWFFWLKSYFQFPEFENKKFDLSEYPDELFENEKKALHYYNLIPSVEIWNIESMNIFFRQIDFYRDAQVFRSDKDIYELYCRLREVWGHLERQATLGYKFEYGDPEEKPLAEYKMYFNEVLLGDNNLFVILDNTKISYLVHTTINFMITRDVHFNENMYQYIQNQVKRSTLISSVSEKERARFFRITRERIEKRIGSLDL